MPLASVWVRVRVTYCPRGWVSRSPGPSGSIRTVSKSESESLVSFLQAPTQSPLSFKLKLKSSADSESHFKLSSSSPTARLAQAP